MKITKNSIWSFLFVLFLMLFFYSGYKVYQICASYSQANQTYHETASQYVKPAAASNNPDIQVSKESAPIQIDFEALSQDAPDIVGWIYCPDTIINYPVVYGKDNDFYLRHLSNKVYNRAGSIFTDSLCSKDFSDFNSILYGHNMNDGSMFATLANYWDSVYRQAHSTMYLLTPEQDYRIDILAGMITSSNSSFYQIPKDQDGFQNFLNQFLSEADFAGDIDLSSVEKVISLSTCSYAFDGARYLVLGSLTALS